MVVRECCSAAAWVIGPGDRRKEKAKRNSQADSERGMDEPTRMARLGRLGAMRRVARERGELDLLGLERLNRRFEVPKADSARGDCAGRGEFGR
jgi:hypothetical protein